MVITKLKGFFKSVGQNIFQIIEVGLRGLISGLIICGKFIILIFHYTATLNELNNTEIV